jgi:hypothetical protein
LSQYRGTTVGPLSIKKCPHHLLAANVINILAASKRQQFTIKFYYRINGLGTPETSLKNSHFCLPLKWPCWLFPSLYCGFVEVTDKEISEIKINSVPKKHKRLV